MVQWRKSSYSTGSGQNCVEVGAMIDWRKPSYSSPTGDNCVEVGSAEACVGVRDTKNRDAGTLAVPRSAWAAFASAAAYGRFASGR